MCLSVVGLIIDTLLIHDAGRQIGGYTAVRPEIIVRFAAHHLFLRAAVVSSVQRFSNHHGIMNDFLPVALRAVMIDHLLFKGDDPIVAFPVDLIAYLRIEYVVVKPFQL